MLEILGGALVICAGGLAGMTVAGRYSHRPEELRALRSALQMLETEITYTATPLAEALGRVAVRCEEGVSVLFEQGRREMLSNPCCTAMEAWEEGIKKFCVKTSLKQKDITVIRGLGKVLGVSDRQDQCKHLRLVIEQLGLAMARAEEEAVRNVKMWNYLGFMGGAALVLLMC